MRLRTQASRGVWIERSIFWTNKAYWTLSTQRSSNISARTHGVRKKRLLGERGSWAWEHPEREQQILALPRAAAHPGFVELDVIRLEYPGIPLNTNASENALRTFVTKRKISGGTMSQDGRDARDVMLGLMKTCQKLGLSFLHFLGDRLGINDEDHAVAPLASMIAARA
nr:hypothetical protein [Rhizobium indicum]